MKRDQVLQLLKESYDELSEKYQVDSLILFGSTARDEANLGNDVDILVAFSEPVGLFRFISLKQHLEKLLGCKVDLGTHRSLKPAIKEKVLAGAIHVP